MSDAPILWSAAEAAAATGGTAQGEWAARGVAIDTRTLAPGDLFVALTSGARDGHGFIAEALARGAAAALASRRPDGIADDAPLLMVRDTLRALEGLAAAARARAAARVVAVTGSVGKTGAKEMMRAMLGAQGVVHAAEGSFNNHIGAPLTLARLPAGCAWAVLELGMNHAGEIAPLSRLTQPHVALITTVEGAHAENFPNEAAIADAKAEIFAGMAPGAIAVLNRDNRWFDRLAAAADGAGLRVIAFGSDSRAQARLIAAEVRGGATVVQAALPQGPLMFKIGAPGLHLAMNAVGALAAAAALGADVARAALALSGWRAPAGRGARWTVRLGPMGMDGEIAVVDESYNANPASVAAALEVLAATRVEDGVGRVARGRRIAVLGDMLELGDGAEAAHVGLADLPAMGAVTRVFAVGPAMRALHEALPVDRRGGWFEDSGACAARLRKSVDAGDVIMVKGSKSMRMGLVVEALKSLGEAHDDAAGEEA